MAKAPYKYNEGVIDKATEYYKTTEIPYIEELAELLDVNDDTIVEWCKAYPEFKTVYDRVMRKQRLSLQKMGLSNKVNSTMAIFQLKTNHGFIETEKRINEHSGDMNININRIVKE